MLASLFRLHFGVFLALCFHVSLLQLCILSFKVLFRCSFYLLALQCLDISQSTTEMLKLWQSCIMGLPGFLLCPFLLECGHLLKHGGKLPNRIDSCKKISSADELDVALDGFYNRQTLSLLFAYKSMQGKSSCLKGSDFVSLCWSLVKGQISKCYQEEKDICLDSSSVLSILSTALRMKDIFNSTVG